MCKQKQRGEREEGEKADQRFCGPRNQFLLNAVSIFFVVVVVVVKMYL